MISRGRALIGALALCALSICAFAAASASASELTAVTCKNAGGAGELNSHCTTGTTGEYKTEAIPLNTKTEVEGTSTEAEPTLRTILSGLSVTVVCETAHVVEGWVRNTEPSEGKHKIDGGAGRVTYTGCKARFKSNEARYCAVEEVTGPSAGTIGMISTAPLEGETTGVEHKIKIVPAEGEILSRFNVLKVGAVPAEENECAYGIQCNVEMKGVLEGEVNTTNHAHLTFTEANNGSGLKNAGAVAKYLDTTGGNMTGTENTVGAQTFT